MHCNDAPLDIITNFYYFIYDTVKIPLIITAINWTYYFSCSNAIVVARLLYMTKQSLVITNSDIVTTLLTFTKLVDIPHWNSDSFRFYPRNSIQCNAEA